MEVGSSISGDDDVARCWPVRGGGKLIAIQAWEEERRKRRVVCGVWFRCWRRSGEIKHKVITDISSITT